MKKTLLYFDDLCNNIKSALISEADEKSAQDVQTQVTVDATAEINGKPVEVTVNASEDIENPNINIDIQSLKLKLENQLEETKKKAYASKLYSTKVGNNPDALRDYGYFLGQKNILISVLKDLNRIFNEPEQITNIEEDQEK